MPFSAWTTRTGCSDPVKRHYNVWAEFADNHERPPVKDLRVRDWIGRQKSY